MPISFTVFRPCYFWFQNVFQSFKNTFYFLLNSYVFKYLHSVLFQFSKLCISERVKYMYLIPFLHCFEIEMYDWSNQPFGIVFIDHQKNKMWICNKIKIWIQLLGFSRNDFDLLFLYNVMDGYSIPLLYFCQSLLDFRNPWDSSPFVLTKLYHFLIQIVYIYILTIFSGFFLPIHFCCPLAVIFELLEVTALLRRLFMSLQLTGA